MMKIRPPMPRPDWRKLIFFALALLGAFPPTTRATTLARLSLEQIAARAPAAARVRCVRSAAVWENGSIWTISTLQVLENMKGALPPEIAVRLPGGRIGHLTAAVSGTPKFARGDEAIVLLEPSRAGGFTVSAWAEGTFRIVRDARTGEETVTQDSSAFAVFDPAARTFRTEGIRRMPMAQFRARISGALARGQEKTR